eukprot:CAMPEP_0176488756 /NCGR_PEP_ID=MMETSP0200_2-20121128/6893_1 /TAXON_ID=947934 /ORGANISM="Chaetoceros sp., Strain GSL56" /LENGTH=402 /DNA_ID=CAMNT_0017885789 /DNA_START=179 /DNA_END=1385 /DNA_ORIENTATION=-
MVTAVTIAAFLSTTAISLAPNVILFLFPDYKPSKEGINPLAIGQALAAGGLLGDVFLHTLPHTLEHDNGEVVGLAVLAGFVVFLLFDILVRSFDDGGHDHHDHHNDSHSKNNNKNNNQRNFTLTSAVVLNLAADSLHNFTDGIAIGASFAGTVHDTSSSMFGQIQELLHSRGGLASLAVLFHEIPHELGDYSILVGAGMTKSQAIMAQFSTAIAAYCGTFVGLYGMQTMKDYLGSDLMVPFTAGGFVYLATVTILPNLLECKVGRRARISQIVAFLVGIGFMYGVALLEHAGGSCGHAMDMDMDMIIMGMAWNSGVILGLVTLGEMNMQNMFMMKFIIIIMEMTLFMENIFIHMNMIMRNIFMRNMFTMIMVMMKSMEITVIVMRAIVMNMDMGTKIMSYNA